MCVETKQIYTMATDPIYIGTGGYTIGRVDNTIVRDPITQIPKIPGSSLAGTWRYYMALKLVSSIRELQPSFEDIKKQKGTNLGEKLKNWINNTKSNNGWDKIKKEWLKYHGNVIATIKCAGQDDAPNVELDQVNHSGHCGHCIVCKAFGYPKKDKSWQGMLFFSDLNILFFPVSTRLGVRWITSKQLLNLAGFEVSEEPAENKVIVSKNPSQESYLNLGWLNLEIDKDIKFLDISQIPLNNIKNLIQDNLILVPDNLISQIINANLEVRTSVSIDPLTGAAKESALFTSEAIPRGTIFYGEIRLMDRSSLGSEDLPSLQSIWQGLKESKDFYKTLGIGGMTTRGFGRMEVYLEEEKKMSNIDSTINNLGFEIVNKIMQESDEKKKKKLLNHIDKALGVLVNDGVYAYYVFCKAQDKKDESRFTEIFVESPLKKLQNFLKIDSNNNLENFFQDLSSNLHQLLFFRQLLERALIYARYHAKAKGE